MGLADLKNKLSYVHLLGILVVVSSVISGISLAMIAYVIHTQTIPFSIVSEEKTTDKNDENSDGTDASIASKAIKEVKLDSKNNSLINNNEVLFIHERRNEEILLSFYKDLQKQRAKLEKDKQNIEEERKALNEGLARSAFIQQSLLKAQEDIKNLFTMIRKEEETNIMRICDLVNTMNPQSSTKLLLQQDNKMVARVLYFLPKKKSATLIEQIVNNPAEGERMKEIYQILHKLTQKDFAKKATGEKNG
ncbi:hypothetical protein AAEX28_14330 [Lentisphaerota bacterium WC36G]|nr:hypothetical protein LJT99_01085 [Lentisphaerae bacterium WC36]